MTTADQIDVYRACGPAGERAEDGPVVVIRLNSGADFGAQIVLDRAAVEDLRDRLFRAVTDG
jgi:hypothetical protein